jgi:hypothetical protein
MANVKNYNEQGGARTVVGGSLDVASGGDLDIESGGALKIAGTQVTASAAELNYLDNSALVAADLTKLAAVTASSTELNILDGVTASAAELNYLDNADLAAADLAKLAGVTATSTEINYLDNSSLTAADLTKLAGVTATSTELNILAGVTTNASELNELDGALFRASFTVGTENTTTGVIGVDVQLADAKNAALAHRAGVYIYLSGDANGDSLITSAVDTLAAGTDGLYIAGVAGKSGHFISESDGDIDVAITTSATGRMYMAVLLPDGTLACSTGIAFA